MLQFFSFSAAKLSDNQPYSKYLFRAERKPLLILPWIHSQFCVKTSSASFVPAVLAILQTFGRVFLTWQGDGGAFAGEQANGCYYVLHYVAFCRKLISGNSGNSSFSPYAAS